DALRELMPLLHGAYCFTLMTESTLYAARDAQGIRPLVLGRRERGWVVASETAALDICGASVVRAVAPGEPTVTAEQARRSDPAPASRGRAPTRRAPGWDAGSPVRIPSRRIW